jgi:hypothetical protein
MSATHITSLYFSDHTEMAKKRLQKLKAAGLVGERPRELFEPAAYFIARPGLDVLDQCGILGEYPYFDLPSLERRAPGSDITVAHDLAVMDVKVAICRAIKSTDLSIVEFTTWPLLNRFIGIDARGKEMTVNPDGFLRVHAGCSDGGSREHTFFLELDRSTEQQTILVSRAGLYANHYRSGNFAEHNGGTPGEYRRHPFRVLYVLDSPERRNNTIEKLLQSGQPTLTHIWLTTFDEIAAMPLDAIWIRPVDYRDRLADTPFDPRRSVPVLPYKRQKRRDDFVEANVSKRPLFDGTPGVRS